MGVQLWTPLKRYAKLASTNRGNIRRTIQGSKSRGIWYRCIRTHAGSTKPSDQELARLHPTPGDWARPGMFIRGALTLLRLSNMSSLAIASDLPQCPASWRISCMHVHVHGQPQQPHAILVLWYTSCQRSLDPPHGGPHASPKVSFTKLAGSQYQDPYKQSCSICKDHGTISVAAGNQTVRLPSATAASFRPKAAYWLMEPHSIDAPARSFDTRACWARDPATDPVPARILSVPP